MRSLTCHMVCDIENVANKGTAVRMYECLWMALDLNTGSYAIVGIVRGKWIDRRIVRKMGEWMLCHGKWQHLWLLNPAMRSKSEETCHAARKITKCWCPGQLRLMGRGAGAVCTNTAKWSTLQSLPSSCISLTATRNKQWVLTLGQSPLDWPWYQVSEVYDFFSDESPKYFEYNADCQGLSRISIGSPVQLAQVLAAPPFHAIYVWGVCGSCRPRSPPSRTGRKCAGVPIPILHLVVRRNIPIVPPHRIILAHILGRTVPLSYQLRRYLGVGRRSSRGGSPCSPVIRSISSGPRRTCSPVHPWKPSPSNRAGTSSSPGSTHGSPPWVQLPGCRAGPVPTRGAVASISVYPPSRVRGAVAPHSPVTGPHLPSSLITSSCRRRGTSWKPGEYPSCSCWPHLRSPPLCGHTSPAPPPVFHSYHFIQSGVKTKERALPWWCPWVSNSLGSRPLGPPVSICGPVPRSSHPPYCHQAGDPQHHHPVHDPHHIPLQQGDPVPPNDRATVGVHQVQFPWQAEGSILPFQPSS